MPQSTIDLNECVSIRFVSVITSTVSQRIHVHNRESHLRQVHEAVSKQNFVQVWVSSETYLGKIRNMIDDEGQGVSSKNEVMIGERNLSDDLPIDFLDNEAVQVHIEYSAANEELRILASDPTKDSKTMRDTHILLLSVPLRL